MCPVASKSRTAANHERTSRGLTRNGFQLTTWVPAEVNERLVKMATARCVPLSEAVREALRAGLDRLEF